MMNELKKIEKCWLNNFHESPLVSNNEFQSNIAYQLFYGFEDDSEFKARFDVGFVDFNNNFNIANAINQLEELLNYLDFIGITIKKENIEQSILAGTCDWTTFLKKTFYLLKQLGRYDNTLDIRNPYFDNLGDLYYFMRLEVSNSKSNQQLSLFEEVQLPNFYNKYIELPKNYSDDEIAIQLFKEIEQTNNSYFITGKAGTGKSTFIHYFTKETSKETLLFAFTGIAAINIGGQTLHSFFGFPFKPILPQDVDIKRFNPNFQKYKILQNTKTIIIDEVSMLRSDLLEALDFSLRINGGNPNSLFGGKQMIFVGDAFQLPPIIDQNDEIQRRVFSDVYESEYFFDSPSFKQINPKLFEFRKVHRQTENDFIENLNKLRSYELDEEVVAYFNQRYNPSYLPESIDFVMMLTSNNYIANSENQRRISRLNYGSVFFEAKIQGEFKEDRFPTLRTLELKRDAQVMFVKNDSYEFGRRWVNGTLGRVNFIKDDNIEVELSNGEVYEVGLETWENRKYQWDKEKGAITSKVIGTFNQFPLKLAWAITIHKSQGLSFDKVNIDLGQGAFVNGQLYTALSRCRDFEGLTLKQKISKRDVIVDNRLVEFSHAVEKGELEYRESLFNSKEDINSIMNRHNGKIIKQDNLNGFIEYDIDKRISYSILKENEFSTGDEVAFEIEQKKVPNSDVNYPVAINLNLISSRKIIAEKSIGLNNLTSKYDCTVKYLVDILTTNGCKVEEKPIIKIGEEETLIIENHFNQLENVKTKSDEAIERGAVINTNVLEVIHPSLIIVEFFNNKKALLSTNNISWNKSRSERIIKNTKKGDEIQVVYLGDDEFSIPIVSKKHLTPRPSETIFWENINLGSVLKGQIFEILVNEVIIELDNNIYGKLFKSNDFKNIIGDQLQFEVLKKDDNSLYVELEIRTEEEQLRSLVKPLEISIDKTEVSLIESSFISFESELQNLENFRKSIYFNFCDAVKEEFFVKAFKFNQYLFSNSINIKSPLYIQFKLNLPAWESDFKNKLLPYLSSDINPNFTEQEALNQLSKEGYWFRVNRYFDNGREQIRWGLFNEEYLLTGYVDSSNFDFIVLSIAIERKRKDKSIQKSRYLSDGTFLYESKILFLSPFQDKPNNVNQEEVFKLLDDKTKAFEIIRELKEESGALLMEEGLSLQIFDRFLEYQENILKKGNVANRIWIDAQFKNVTSDLGELSIELSIDLEDLCEANNVTALVTIRTIQLSTKSNRDEEFVFFSDATLEIIPKGSRLHFRNEDILLDDLKGGFYLEPKISIRQFQVQREVLQDFFAKKIKLSHIESLLLRPEKIQAPEMSELNFFDDKLKETEESSHENNQIKSVKKSVGNKNIFLIQGPPGTGKTTVIAEIVQQLVSKGEKILVTSQTHIAVDNVLEKLSYNSNLSLLRLGNIQRVKTELIKYHQEKQVEIYSNYFMDSIKLNIKLTNQYLSFLGKMSKNDLVDFVTENHNYPDDIKDELMVNNFKFIDSLIHLDFEKVDEIPQILEEWTNNISNELETLILPLMYNSIDVVFATCIGVRTDRDLSQYNVVFDTVIIDEAGKANLSESIAAISMAKKVILVGDQKQLPPYIDGSLLDPNEKNSFPNTKFGSKYLDDDIQRALRSSFFEFLVKRISEENFPKSNIEMLNYQHRMHPHIGQFISDAFYNGELKMGEKTSRNVLPMPSPFDKQVVFIDTSTADDPYESKVGVSVKNDTEAQCISQLVVPELIKNGLTPKNFAIVAPYKSQVTNIKKHLSDLALYDQIDVSTLDSFQGMEFDVIVFSFTRSAFNTKVGFLDDARRLNVAFSRAKKKLILIGNTETLVDKRSHYDQLFDYTGLFKKLVQISKNPNIGNFVNVTDFTDLKSRFQTQIGKFELGEKYLCKLKLTFEHEKYLGHIFYLNGSALEAMFMDRNKDFSYDTDLEYNMFISGIDNKNERIQLSPKPIVKSKRTVKSIQIIKSTFIDKHKIGDKISVRYKHPIIPGHLFQIEENFDCLLYDPKKLKSYQTDKSYSLYIVKIDHKIMTVGVSEENTLINKPSSKVKSNNRKRDFQKEGIKLKFFIMHKNGDVIDGNYVKSNDLVHTFLIENSFEGQVFDENNKHVDLVGGRTYKLQIVKLDSGRGKITLEIKKF